MATSHNDSAMLAEKEHYQHKHSAIDDMFGVENRSVEMLIEELKSESLLQISDDSENSISMDKSPTKPLNISRSEISLHNVLDDDGLHRSDSKLKGPRNLQQTQSSPMAKVKGLKVSATPLVSPSKKVQIDFSPPKVMEYDQMTSEEENTSRSGDENDTSESSATEPVHQWAASPSRPFSEKGLHGKPLPPIRPSPSDISIRSMPNMRFENSIMALHSPEKVSNQFNSSDDSGASEDVSMTADDLIFQQKKIPMEQRLSAMLESPKSKEVLNFDNDNYLEDERLGLLRQKSDVRRNKKGRETYLDDVLLHKIKIDDENQELGPEDLGDLYEPDVRNTKGNQLTLCLEKTTSHQSQASMLSTERNLETTDGGSVAKPISLKDGMKGFSDELLLELVQAPQSAQSSQQVKETVEIDNVKPLEPPFSGQISTPQTHERKSSVSSVLSPSKVGQFFYGMGKSVSTRFSGNETKDTGNEADLSGNGIAHTGNASRNVSIATANESIVSQSEADSDYKSAEENFYSSEDEEFGPIIASRNANSDTSGLTKSSTLQDVSKAAFSAADTEDDKTDTEFSGNSTEELLVVNKQRLLNPADISEDHLANSTEISEENHEGNSESTIDMLNSADFRLEVPRFDDDPHAFSVDLEPEQDSSLESIKRSRHRTSEICHEVSPKQEMLSIWQSQRSLRKVSPKLVVMEKPSPKPVFPTRKVSPRSVNVVQQRIVSVETNKHADTSVASVQTAPTKASRVVSLGQFIDLPGDQDFADQFRSWMVNELSQEDDEDEKVKFLNADFKSPHLIEKNGSVARIWRNGTVSEKQNPSYKLRSQKLQAAVEKMMETKDSELTFKTAQPVAKVTNNAHGASHKGQSGELLNLDFGIENITKGMNSFEVFEDNSPTPTPVAQRQTVPAGAGHNSAASRYAGLVPQARKGLRPLIPTDPNRVNSTSGAESYKSSKAIVEEAVQSEVQPEEEPRLVNGESGRLFVRLVGLEGLQLPGVKDRDAEFCVVLDNGIHTIKTKYFKLSQSISTVIEKEFELIVADKLEFIITLKMRYSKPKAKLVEVTETKTVKSKNKFARLFGAKDIVTTTKYVNKAAENDPWDSLFAADGSFARATMSFDDYKKAAWGKVQSTAVPLLNEWKRYGGKRTEPYTIGKLQTELLFIPRTLKHEILPASIKEALEFVQQAREQSSISHEGFMFQEGGDSPYWKRRFFKLQGTDLIAHHETTLRPRARINLKKVVALDYFGKDQGSQDSSLAEFRPPHKTMASLSSRNFSDTLLVNDGFRLKFSNGETIDFGADTKEEKSEWIQLVDEVTARNNFVKQPWIQLMLAKA
ncbi:unnamed protein product [Kuraishia capsulata CBS 1993]|uniref:PH domain-containing protein n=1 Tax=Kuraishia capsulata CBS 1993 TaxID=1382522 RepID=W6MVK4_9ASCO|nr:uncharacterized protein KUCA_T00002332001 [Kuraishia capsulata CBS 1993]CDK26360.1 unnamed protein product [Kuraishia capsulata CBS 1993]